MKLFGTRMEIKSKEEIIGNFLDGYLFKIEFVYLVEYKFFFGRKKLKEIILLSSKYSPPNIINLYK